MAGRAWAMDLPICTTRGARRRPFLNVVGDQATHHRPLDPPLTADTEGWARGLSAWTRVVQSVATIGALTPQPPCRRRGPRTARSRP